MPAFPEAPLEDGATEPAASEHADANHEREALAAESLGLVILVVLDALCPGKRVACVPHDMFGVSFEEISRRG